MIEQQCKIYNFQSDVFNLFMKQAEQLNSLNDYLVLIEKCCSQHFGIDKSCFLVKEGDVLKPISNCFVDDMQALPITVAMIDAHFYEQLYAPLPYFLAAQQGYTQFQYIVRLQLQSKTIGAFLFTSCQAMEYLQQIAESLTSLLTYVQRMTSLRLSEEQYRKLYNVSDLFHSTMDMDLIIENVLKTVESNFPTMAVDLILSNDQDRHTTFKVKPFDYLSERSSTIEAFVSGEITTEYATDLDMRLINVPIKGRQAIYGILQMRAPSHYTFTQMEKDFIRMLCAASGNALENAKLYHQSHRLISDLQLINETTHRLNMKLNIQEMLSYLRKQLMKSFQPMEVCFVLVDEEGHDIIVDASTALFKRQEGAFYTSHVKKHFEQTYDPLFVADFSRIAEEHVQYKSVMAIPMLIEERLNGYAIVLHEDSYFFSFDSYKLMQSLIHHSSLAISNSILRNKLQEMVDRDHLTKLYARSYLDSYVEHSLQHDRGGMFMLIDIDNFKRVNDTFGHQVGDDILVQISRELRNVIDTKGICARWGGEELAVYAPNIVAQEALKLAEQIVRLIPSATEPAVTISAGLITWEETNRPEFQSIFLHADKALYTAKNSGKNQVRLFTSDMLFQAQQKATNS